MNDEHDIVIGFATTTDDETTVHVVVTGTDVRVDIRRNGTTETSVLLSPDDTEILIGLLEEAGRPDAPTTP